MDKVELWNRLQDVFSYPVPIKRSTRLRTYWLRALKDLVTISISAVEMEPLAVLIRWTWIWSWMDMELEMDCELNVWLNTTVTLFRWSPKRV